MRRLIFNKVMLRIVMEVLLPLRELDVLAAFKRYCALGVFAANLHKLGNVLQEKARKQCEKSRKAA